MTLLNRLGNSKNPYQTSTKKVLCVCSAGLLRSPTAANVLWQVYGYNTRACGCSSEYALVPVDLVLLEWADEVVFMQREHMEKVLTDYPDWNKDSKTEMTVLDIPDTFSWGDGNLKAMIKERYAEAGDNVIGSDNISSSD